MSLEYLTTVTKQTHSNYEITSVYLQFVNFEM